MKSKIKTTLPNFPDEIIDQWLLPFAETEGWPPMEKNGNLFGRWRYLLGRTTNLNYWQNIKWKREDLDLMIEHLDEISKNTVMQIIEAAVFGNQNLISLSIIDLKERFDRIVSYFALYGVYPVPPVFIMENERYKLMDGNHRVAAYFYCAGYITKSPPKEVVLKTRLRQPAWVGKS